MTVSSFTNWLYAMLCSWKTNGTEENMTMFSYLLWLIWKARNDWVFSNVQPNPMAVLILAKAQCLEFLQLELNSGPKEHIGALKDSFTKWRPPRPSTVKVNTDAALNKDTGKGFAGIICRDHRGNVVTSLATHLFSPNALVAEALALREAIHLCHLLKLPKSTLESDNLDFIETCRGNMVIREI